MTNIVRDILEYNAGRDPERLRMKLARLVEDPFIFLRGTCHLFYPRLPEAEVLGKAPAAWSCGDLHLENFGSFRGDNGQVYFDLNDFDEAALAPCTWDPLRLVVSLRLAASVVGLSRSRTLDLCRTLVDAYAAALAEGRARWIEREIASGMVRHLLDDLRTRKRSKFLKGRTVKKHGRRWLRVDGRQALAASDAQRSAVESLMASLRCDRQSPGFWRVLDVARRIAGTGSLGVDRFVILVEGEGSPNGNHLLDLKQSLPTALGPRIKLPQPQWANEASRIVAVQQRIQAVSPALLTPIESGGNSYILRALQPSADRIELDLARDKPERLTSLVETLGGLVAWGQLRGSGREGSAIADDLIAFGRDQSWHAPLLELTEQAAAQVERDWSVYVEAYRAGLVLSG